MPNALAREKSPYLLQHQDNPVDWLPWGEAAFARARAEDKPLLVSIGYSSCHWCHVMEEESFSDPAVAAVMNRELVCVKVDREERPDVDRVYMAAITATTGQGGWPLNCFVAPDGRPMFGGTYFPPRRAYGRPSWAELVAAVGQAWRDPAERLRLLGGAAKLTQALLEAAARRGGAGEEAGAYSAAAFMQAADRLLPAFEESFDEVHGGFSPAPKFPTPSNQLLLFRLAARLRRAGRTAEAERALALALQTLQHMARGGIHDHLGGGFCRYSTDARWHVPHFEKMLTDNAQLLLNYAEAFQVSGEPSFAVTARGIASYLLRDLRDPGGAFYCAEDADSLPEQEPARSSAKKKEGAFYTWSYAQLEEILGPDTARFAAAHGAQPGGNVEHDPHGELRGVNVLFDARTDAEAGEEPGRPSVAALRLRLFDSRSQRPRPFRDEKILTGWNGLAIAGLARASWILGEPAWCAAAEGAATFLLGRMRDGAGAPLYRRLAGGERAIPAQADDYAGLAWGLLELHQATLAPRWLEACRELVEQARQLYGDEVGEPGAAAGEAPAGVRDPLLPLALREEQDGALPAPSSLFADLQLRLWSLTGERAYRDRAERLVARELRLIERVPQAVPYLAAAALRAIDEPVHVALLGDPGTAAFAALLAALRKGHRPLLDVVAMAGESDGVPRAQVCLGLTCQLPLSTPTELAAALVGT